MSTRDQHIDRNAYVARKNFQFNPVIAISQTRRPFFLHRPGVGFQVEGLETFCAAKAGTCTIEAFIVGDTELITAGAVTVHSTPEQLALALTRALVSGTYVEKGAATAITFTAAHVVSANKFGVILVQMNASGTVSTKVPAATQAYDDATSALAALPAADSDKVGLASIVIGAKGTAWTANTDDMTAGSDLTSITITSLTALSPVNTALAPVAMQRAVATLVTQVNRRAREITKGLLLCYNSDGSASLTGLSVTATIRAFPINGEA